MLVKLNVLHEVVVASFDTSTFVYRESPIQGTGPRLMVEYTNRHKDVLSRIKM